MHISSHYLSAAFSVNDEPGPLLRRAQIERNPPLTMETLSAAGEPRFSGQEPDNVSRETYINVWVSGPVAATTPSLRNATQQMSIPAGDKAAKRPPRGGAGPYVLMSAHLREQARVTRSG
ncbi:hypothetical protein AUCHE_18_00630 [Austwickia chelonae NBRC 105200]|uniref:Uncharacterized protein n=1 Tax=Austwickia chelonae NBRC 105200 TaxID=1184607 RepID=K6WB71_9MICO|nr:hypothetical protein AUCHE_18_00630 [Austwickia chelonae NBRC 105200]